MANYYLTKDLDQIDAQKKVLVTEVSSIHDQTATLLNMLESEGEAISKGLAGFIPQLKEILPSIQELSETFEKANGIYDRTLAELQEVDKLSSCSLDD